MADFDTPNREAPIVDDADHATLVMFIWMQNITDLLQRGFTGSITTAPLTGGGGTGSMTFENGILISQTPAT